MELLVWQLNKRFNGYVKRIIIGRNGRDRHARSLKIYGEMVNFD
jgi:hypothetical protein